MHVCMYIYIYIYIYICSLSRSQLHFIDKVKRRLQQSEDDKRQTFIHIHQSIITAYNSNQAYVLYSKSLIVLIVDCLWIDREYCILIN